MTDEELQRAYQGVANQAPTGPCPEPEDLAELVQGVGSESARLEMLEHVLRCPTCQPELDLLRAANEGARAGERARTSTPWMALAAAIVIAIGVGALALRDVRTGPPVDTLRGRAQSIALFAPLPGATVAPPVHITWRSIPGAQSYRAELLTPGGDLVAAWSTPDTTFAIPDSVRLDAGASYNVWIRATLADRTEASSPVVRFRVR